MVLTVKVKEEILQKTCQYCGKAVKGLKEGQVSSYLDNHQRSVSCKKIQAKLKEKKGVDNGRIDIEGYS